MIDCIFTETGFSEMINNPSAKKDEKIKPMMTSSFRRVR
ncbi:hypothetical protein UUU_24910 (plasmid) [Klebsiella pneumoniae subsp. pneumoniae DSM 30104 = JCM 1662 = NBRC 14940]|nr:hypothetical protein UUU_24910 [Klebsiella pneumoniae subsp. pneumoniae DSM 30104 = JCM 1662 = NBRC 14940]